MTPRIRPAVAEDLSTAAETLTAAFADYSWTRYVIPEDGYPERLRALQTLYLEHAHRHGLVAVCDSGHGVIALLPPDAPGPGQEMVERVIALHGDRIDRIDRLTPGGGGHIAWRLETLGVHPDRQGRELGSALLRFALDTVAQRGGREIDLETSDPRNVRLYERHGFAVIAHSQQPGVPPVWSMRAASP